MLQTRIEALKLLLAQIDPALYEKDRPSVDQALYTLSRLQEEVTHLLEALEGALRIHIRDCQELVDLFEKEP
jgi:hypothetical protein